MKKFDIVFLLLSTLDSKRFDLFLGLYAALANAGFHTAMATHPYELKRPNRRLRIVIIDGSEDSGDFDPFQVTRSVRSWHGSRQCIVFVTDAHPHAFERAREAGADICVHAGIEGTAFCDVLSRLAQSYAPGQSTGSRTPWHLCGDAGNEPYAVAATGARSTPRPEGGRDVAAVSRIRTRRRK